MSTQIKPHLVDYQEVQNCDDMIFIYDRPQNSQADMRGKNNPCLTQAIFDHNYMPCDN